MGKRDVLFIPPLNSKVQVGVIEKNKLDRFWDILDEHLPMQDFTHVLVEFDFLLPHKVVIMEKAGRYSQKDPVAIDFEQLNNLIHASLELFSGRFEDAYQEIYEMFQDAHVIIC